jgi:tRNA(Ile)-lysidine synthase
VVPLPLPGVASVRLVRPLLDIGRVELRDYLIRRGVAWLEDPMNADPRFARARIRKLIPALAEAGISTGRIVSASRHLARARLALDASAQYFLQCYAQFGSTGVAIDGAVLADLPREIGLRALSTVLLRVAGARYRPRFERLERLFDSIALADFRRQTLAGCCVGRAPRARAVFGPKTIWIVAEKPRRSAVQAGGKNRPGKELPEPVAAGD